MFFSVQQVSPDLQLKLLLKALYIRLRVVVCVHVSELICDFCVCMCVNVSSCTVCNFCCASPSVNYDMSTAKELLLLASSTAEQQKWVGRLLKRIPRKSSAPVPALTHTPAQEPLVGSPPLSSPHLSPRNSPRLSPRGAIRVSNKAPPSSAKNRWVNRGITFSLVISDINDKIS